ncbi:DNA-directed RNA polymerase sigma-70 factor [Prolixibacter sp. NT017]|nr:DNA-directed RNA polymerase sigma-70 factor [Prolixibacter sp. NT017]
MSLSVWVENHTQELYSWALHKVSDSELAADLVQETFLAAAEKIDSFKGDSSPKTWLFSILNHKIIDHYRKKVKQPVHMDNQAFSHFFSDEGDWKEINKPKNWHEQENENHLLDDHEFHDILKKCLAALPDKWGICVKLKYLSDKNGDEICQELDITPSNYWQIVHRAKLQLRECIEKNWFN